MYTREQYNACAEGKVVIDATNSLSAFPALAVHWDGNTSGGEMCAAALPKSAVISGTGFSPKHVGPIRYARNLEAIAELWIHLAVPPAGETRENWGWAFAFHAFMWWTAVRLTATQEMLRKLRKQTKRQKRKDHFVDLEGGKQLMYLVC